MDLEIVLGTLHSSNMPGLDFSPKCFYETHKHAEEFKRKRFGQPFYKCILGHTTQYIHAWFCFFAETHKYAEYDQAEKILSAIHEF